MTWYPADTECLLKQNRQTGSEHLWYSVHYNQLEKFGSRDFENYEGNKKEKSTELQKDLTTIELDKNFKDITLLVSEHISTRTKALAQLCLSRSYAVFTYCGDINYGVIHGLGGAHVRESGLTIHPVYGCPYIPASSVKGLVRRWFIEAFLRGEEHLLSDPIHDKPESENDRAAAVGQLVFGSKHRRGAAQFYDVFLFKNARLVPDMNNQLFPDYYRGSQDAGDDQQAKLSGYYHVTARNIEFTFSLNLSFMSDLYLGKLDEKLIGQLLGNWLGKALNELGIGSKTAAGFGRVTNFKETTHDSFDKEINRLENLEREKEENERKKKLEERLGKMTDEERLIYEINQLDPESQEDKQNSKSTLFDQVTKLNNKESAQQLKNYWLKTGDWRVNKKKKQFGKVQKIKQILGETN